MSAKTYKKTIIEYDPTLQAANRLPKVHIMGMTMARFQMGNSSIDICGTTEQQTLTLLRAFRELISAALSDLEEKQHGIN